MMLILAAAEEGGFNPLKPELGLPIWVTLAFAVVLYFLAKKVFPLLAETLADRERRVKQDLQEAEETKLQAEKLLEDYRARVAQVREEANRVAEEIREQAQAVAKDLVAKTEAQSREILARAQAQLASERERTVNQLQTELARWSTEIAGRILDRELSPEAHRDLVESFIREVLREGQPS